MTRNHGALSAALQIKAVVERGISLTDRLLSWKMDDWHEWGSQ
jgi:hypothetical protein